MTGGGSGAGACAVCKHQRRKCEPNCELAAYFPANRMNDFRALHLVFGVANLTKLIKANATEAARRRAAETLTWEARWRERDPSEGCYREVSCLRRDNAVLRAENAALRRQAEQCACCCGGGAGAVAVARHTSSAALQHHHQHQLLLVSAYNGNGTTTARPGSVPHNASNGRAVVPAGFAGVRGANGNGAMSVRPPPLVQAPPATQTVTGFVAQDERYRVVSICPASNGGSGGGGGGGAAVPRSGAAVRGQGDSRDKSDAR
ncbi:protein ASYMMETRIC LEAVES 2-like [Oryza brachyantha]|uniref:protein ASYMMETRIC LEAVES 2-like n=1 Tax=Oryza brachyantha TaxID=4533 RepID=UPI001AD95C2C|nr:protein ASYMMETRIC LEAVES 2-like [Oryza brachyantha]